MSVTATRNPAIDSSPTLEFKNATRQQTSLLAPLERMCLRWLARKMPLWVKPDHLTLLGFAAMLAAGVCYALSKWWAPSLLIVNLFIALNWFGDSLDGTLARARNKQRPRYGFYVDHIIDSFGAVFLLCGLGLSAYMSWSVAFVALIAFLLLSIELYLASYTIGTFKLSHYKFSPTELRVLLVVGNVRAFLHPTAHVFGGEYRLFDVGAVIAVVLMSVILIISVVRNTITLYRAERV
jgi:phosphatidylglycerophosphate synthase